MRKVIQIGMCCLLLCWDQITWASLDLVLFISFLMNQHQYYRQIAYLSPSKLFWISISFFIWSLISLYLKTHTKVGIRWADYAQYYEIAIKMCLVFVAHEFDMYWSKLKKLAFFWRLQLLLFFFIFLTDLLVWTLISLLFCFSYLSF